MAFLCLIFQETLQEQPLVTYNPNNDLKKLIHLFVVVNGYDITGCQACKVSQCVLQSVMNVNHLC